MGTSPSDSTKNGDKSTVQSIPTESTDPTLDSKQDGTVKQETATTAPLAPPPRPGVTAPTTVANTPDYFSVAHSGSHLSYETNPFEHQFAGGDGSVNGVVQTPGGTKLPGVSALTSPSGLLGTGSTSNFWGGLRTGPLSPAMLSGPQKEDYFSDGHHLRGGFPTPNESSMRSGLTPGGGGSMFPEPSPNSQALFNQLASGGATPSTLEFHRTAMSAAAAQKREAQPVIQKNITSQPSDLGNNLEVKPPTGQFDQHDANDAANGLFLLAQARSGPQNTNHYAMAPQMNAHAHPQPAISMQGHSTEASPTMSNHIHNGSISTNSGRAVSEVSEDNGSQSRPNTRGKGKKGAVNGRRKAEETPSKAPANKKAKGNNGRAISEEPQMSEEELDMSKEEFNANGKKMTDEEKRKNFLERNRVAALKCRQRKKQWLANLQQKCEMYSQENDSLNAQIAQMRDETVNLKTILLAHKECNVTRAQGLHGIPLQQVLDGGVQIPNYGQMNPYGMAMSNHQAITGQDMQRRYS